MAKAQSPKKIGLSQSLQHDPMAPPHCETLIRPEEFHVTKIQ